MNMLLYYARNDKRFDRAPCVKAVVRHKVGLTNTRVKFGVTVLLGKNWRIKVLYD
jgi:hypothetical protein